MNVSIDHPTSKVNFTIVYVGSLTLAFSYKTIIGFQMGWESWVLHENVWGPTTGKHLNYLSENKKDRLTSDEFDAQLRAVLVRLAIEGNDAS